MNGPPHGNFTMIDDLPDLEEMERRGGIPPHLAHNMGPPLSQPTPDQYQKFIRSGHVPPPQSGMTIQPPPPQIPPERLLTCLDIAEHVHCCPICSKFYNNDRSIYIIAIVVLVVICILLLKRVLDV